MARSRDLLQFSSGPCVKRRLQAQTLPLGGVSASCVRPAGGRVGCARPLTAVVLGVIVHSRAHHDQMRQRASQDQGDQEHRIHGHVEDEDGGYPNSHRQTTAKDPEG